MAFAKPFLFNRLSNSLMKLMAKFCRKLDTELVLEKKKTPNLTSLDQKSFKGLFHLHFSLIPNDMDQ